MRAILALGLPLIGSQIAQFAIHMTDTLMLGWYDVRALAAVTLASSYWFVLFITGAGFGLAVAPMVAAAQARGDLTRARRVTRMGLHASIAYGALVLPLMLWAAPVLGALGQEAHLAELAQSYLRIAAWGIFPALGVMVLKNYLAAMGNTRVILMVTLSASKPCSCASRSERPVRATSNSKTLTAAVPTTPLNVASPPATLVPATRPCLLAVVPSGM